MVCHIDPYKLKNCQGKSNLNLKFGQIQVSNGRYVANVVIVVVIIVVVVVDVIVLLLLSPENDLYSLVKIRSVSFCQAQSKPQLKPG